MTGQGHGPAPPLSRAETTAVLGEVLRRVSGADARLVDWTAERLKHGRHPVVRYDLRVTLGGGVALGAGGPARARPAGRVGPADRGAAAWGSRPRAPAVATERRRDARPRPLRARRPGAGPRQPARAVAPHRPAAAG